MTILRRWALPRLEVLGKKAMLSPGGSSGCEGAIRPNVFQEHEVIRSLPEDPDCSFIEAVAGHADLGAFRKLQNCSQAHTILRIGQNLNRGNVPG
jgi:hypothetical protein